MATDTINFEQVNGQNIVRVAAAFVKKDDLIIRITIDENTGIVFPSEYIVEETFAFTDHVFLELRAGGSTYTEPFTMSVPRDAVVAVTV